MGKLNPRHKDTDLEKSDFDDHPAKRDCLFTILILVSRFVNRTIIIKEKRMDLNKVSLIGNLVKEPVSRKTTGGQSVTSASIATNYIWRDAATKKKKESVEFHNIVAWGRLADIMAEYLKKGSKVYIEGRLASRNWTDKTGKKRYVTEVVAEDLIMLGHRGTRDEASTKSAEALAKEEVAVEDLA